MRRFIDSLKARRRNRRARFDPHGRRPYGFEQLEGRYLLSAVSWTGAGDGTSWTNPANWSTHALPGPADDVTISISGTPTIQLASGVQSINSLVTTNFVKLAGGTLQIGTTAQIGANLTLAGGTIMGGTFNETGGAVISLSTFGGKLDGVTINGVIDAATQSGNMTVYDGLTLNGALSLGNVGGSTSGQILFGDSTHAAGGLMGTGSVVFGASFSDSINNNSNLGGASGTLTLGPNITIHGQSGSIVNDFTTGSVINEGAINADTSGGAILLGSVNGSVSNQGSVEVINGASLTITDLVNQSGATVTATGSTLTLGGSLSNLGTITVANSTVNFTGNFSQADLGNFNRSGGTVNVTGNVNGNLTLDAGTGSWNFLSGSSLSDGTLTENDGVTAGFAPTGGLLVRETINGDFNLTLAQSGSITVGDSLTVTGNLRLGNASGTNSAVIILGTGAAYFGSKSAYDNTGPAGYHVSTDTVLTVGGQIIFGPSTGNGIVNNNLYFIPKPGPNDPPAVTSFDDAGVITYFGGSKIEVSGAIQGGKGSITNFYSRSTIQIDTSVTADGANSAITVGGGGGLGVVQDTLINQGTLQATNGGSLAVGDLTQSTGTVSVTGSSLTLFNSVANSGTITATNSSVNLNGTFTQAQLGTFNCSGSIVDLSGTLMSGLTLNASTGSWFLHTGTVMGGTISESGGAELAFTNFGGVLKNGVTFNGDMDLDAGLNAALQGSPHLNVDGGLTLNGTMYLGNTASSAFGSVDFGDNVNVPGSLVGNGTVVFGGTSIGGNFLANGWNGMGPQTFTIGPNITIRGQSGSLAQQNGTTGNTIVLQGAVSADVAGGTIQLGTNGPVINEGSIQAINGGTISGVNLINNAGQTILINGSTLSLSSGWSNAGTIVATNSTLNLSGNFTRATLGNFVRTGGTVNLKGTLSGGLNLDAANGSWTLLGGTINGGAVNTSGGSQLILSNLGGTIAGVTINGNVDATQQSAQATFTGGLVLNGTITMGTGSNSSATLTFGKFNGVAPGSLTGNGTIVFASNEAGGNTIHNGSNLTGASGTFTIGSTITIQGKTGGFFNDFTSGTIINEGKIIAEDAAGTISIGTDNGTFSNQGTMQANSGTIRTLGTLSIDGSGTLSTNFAGSILLGGNISGNSTAFASSNPQGVITLNAGSSSANPQLIEAMSQDLGNTAAGFKNNFVYGTINVATAYAKLVDQFANAPGGPNALYVDSLLVNSLETLDLNGIHVYARAVQINGAATVLNGTITQLPDGGPLDLNSPLPGAISPAGNVDTWTFFGRAGEVITTYVNPGTGTAPVPILPNLNWAGVQLLGPDSQVLASGASANLGTAVSLANITLPVDGTYSIQINAASGHSSSTGNYVVAAFDVTPRIAPLVLAQNSFGSINTPFDVQQWTFTALAGEQVKFHLINETSTGLLYTLSGPSGYSGFSNLTGDSPLINLPSSGSYTLSVQGSNGATGNYSFVVMPTTLTSVPLNGSINGTLAGSGQAELFSIDVPTVQTLSVSLQDLSTIDSNELYLKFGSPPTRESFDYRYGTASAADQNVLVPSAAIGTWFVLLYAANVPGASSFSLTATGAGQRVVQVTPAALGNAAPATLRITGAGFEPGTTVTLVGSGNTEYPAASTSVVSYTQLTATFAAGLPPDEYTVRVNQGGNSDSLQNAFTVTAGGSAKLETNLQVPSFLGRHIPATIYITYANAGTVAMPAPLLVLASTNPAQKPLFTLDATKITQGLHTSTIPDGYGNTIQILASGTIPGVLLPGESITVPVYYAGLQQPWDFSQTSVPLNLGVVATTDTSPVDWNSLKSSLEPPDVPNAAWNQMYANLIAPLGNTWGQYVAALDNNATYLGSLGENVSDINVLWGFMAAQANDALGPFEHLVSVSDASLSLPGGGALGFVRNYHQAIDSRYASGMLGLGWSVPWQTTLVQSSSDGSFTLSEVGEADESFQADSRGGYFSSDGSLTLIANSDGTHTVTNSNGNSDTYGANGNLLYGQDATGNRITLNYNASGQLIGLVASSGQSLTLAYNAAGLLHSVTDSVGRLTTYSYDLSNQYLLSVTGPSGTTSYTYDTVHNGLASLETPAGTHTYFTYNAQGRLSGMSVDGNSPSITFTHDQPGELTATDAANDAFKMYFDASGYPAKAVDPLGNPTYLTYDGDGNLLSSTDAAGNTFTYTYDAAGNLTTATDPLHDASTFTYGQFGRITSFTDPNNNPTTYAYDGKGNLTTINYPDGSQSSYSFDPTGDPLSFVNRNGQTTGYTFNAFGQITKETFADGSHYDYSYDGHGNLLTAANASGTIIFTYDAADRMTSVTYPGNQSLTFTYDSGGRRIQMTDQSGYTVKYVYDAVGRLWKLTDASNNPIATYTYDATGRLSRQDNANGTYSTYQYDAAGNLLHLINFAPGGGVNSRFDYSYNLLSQTTSTATLDGTWTYSYDSAGQLIRAIFTSVNPSVPNQDLAYSYDPAGNRTSTIINGVTSNYTANSVNEDTNAGGTLQLYDSDGNLISDGTSTYSYNQLDQLIGVSSAGGTQQFTYNALGQRIDSSINGQTTNYLLDPAGDGNLIAEYDNTGALITHFNYGAGLVSQTTAAGSSYFYDADAAGSIVGLSSSSAIYVNSYSYLPFGQILASSGTLNNPFQYVGALGVQTDAPGLLDMRARDYNPSTGAFISSDPVQLLGGTNFYTYVSNAPLQLVDPHGLGEESIWTSKEPSWTGKQVAGKGVALLVGIVDNLVHGEKPDVGVLATTTLLDSELVPSLGPVLGLLVKEPDIALEGANGILGLALQSKCETTNAGQAAELVAAGVAPPGCAEALRKLKGPEVPENAGVTGDSALVNSGDPNDKVGPAGFGASDFLAAGSLLPYRIDFENASTASAPAQQVEITDQLSSNVDWSSFRITEIGWGDLVLAIPPDSQHYQTTVPMTYNGETFDVLVQLGINLSTGLITAQFFSVDPLTELPPDVLTGFLPPEDGTGRGMGHISYTVSPIAGLPTGTQIRNVADVSFDEQPIITTDQVSETDPAQGTDPTKEALVTIDAGPPTSSVAALPPTEASATFSVSWSGQDDAGGSGIGSYDVYVSDNGGPFTLFQTNTTAISATFTGQGGHTYGFFSVATDNVGNQQSLPIAAQAMTTIATQLSVTTTADSGPGSFRQAILDANNSLGADTIQFQIPAGPQTITLLTSLPMASNPLTLSLDASQNVTVVGSSATAWNNDRSLTLSGAGSLTFGGGVEGAGNLTINDGSNLTAGHIVQSALVIGGTAGSPAIVTIAASDASGNPLSSATAIGEAASSAASASNAPNGEAAFFELQAAYRARRLAQVATAKTTADGDPIATGELQQAAVALDLSDRAPTASPAVVPYLTDALFGENAKITAPQSSSSAIDWEQPTTVLINPSSAVKGPTIDFVATGRNAGARRIVAGGAVDAALAESDFATALDDSLLELLVPAVHQHRSTL